MPRKGFGKKFPKVPKDMTKKEAQKAVEQAKKDFDAFLAALKSIAGPQKKAADSLSKAAFTISDVYYDDDKAPPKERDGALQLESDLMDLFRAVGRF